MRDRLGVCTSLVLLLVFLVSGNSAAQVPDTFTNLRVLPENTTRDELMNVMRGFSFALGVRCQHCHFGGDGVSFEGVEFSSDEKPQKQNARFMMRMTNNLNLQVLPLLPEREAPAVRIECKTCHRSRARPLLLKQELLLALDASGTDSAIARYRELRREYADRGVFDFGEWEVNSLAESLTETDRFGDAVAIYELNLESFPDSIAIHFSLGKLYEELGKPDRARTHFERVIELRPGHRGAKERLEALNASG